MDCPKPFLHPSRGQSSFELLVIISFVVLVVTAYLAAFSQEFFPVSALANAKVAAISAASASVRGSCTFYGLERISIQDSSKIGMVFRALSTGTPCASISRSAISARLGSLPFPYSLNITHETGAGTASSIVIPVTPEFTMSASPSASSIAQGGAAPYSLNLIPVSGFSASVSLGASGLPSGATAAFSPASVMPAGTSAVSIQTSPTTPTGTYTITFIATGGGVTRTSTVTLTVTGASDFSIAASPASASVALGSTASYSVSLTPSGGFSSSVSLSASGLPAGATATFSPTAVTPSGTSALAVQTSASTPAGTYTITVSGTGGGITRTGSLSLTVSAAADFAVSAASLSVVQGSSNTTAVSLTAIGGFSSAVSLSASGLPAGVTYSFSPPSVTPSGTSTLTIQASPTTPAGTYTVTVSGTGGGITRSSSLSLTVSASADFAIATSPTSLSVIQGSSNATTVSLTPAGGFSSSVSLSASGLPAGAAATFSPTAVTPSGTSTLAITTSLSTPAGTYMITVSGTGGGITRNSTVVLVIGVGTISPASTQTSLSGFYNLYSPSVLDYGGVKRMWLGGWLAKADELEPACTLNGADKMYYSELAGASWTWPAPINWTNPGYTPGKKPCYHINDPTVIKDPTRDVLYMYYTAFPDEYVPMGDYSKHAVGFANSTDGGKTWTDHGIVVAPTDSGDGKGAWSPSAIVAGSEIWVYYHTGTSNFSQPIDFRTRFDLTGQQKIGAPQRLSFSGVTAPPLLANVDVSRQGSQYIMFADTLGGDHLNNITMYVSSDGLNWSPYPPGGNTIIGAGANTVLTPNAEILGPDRYAIYFGYATVATNRSDSIQRWEFVIP